MVRALIRFPEDEAHFNAFLDEFQRESDRAAAVLSAAYLDAKLADLLKAAFAVDSKGPELLDVNQPLGSFGPRTTLAEAVGLITHEERQDLELVRRIRNDFAHELHGLSFNTEKIASRCREFACNRDYLGNPPVRGDFPDDPRSRFNLATALLAWYLHLRIQAVAAFRAPRPPLWPEPMMPMRDV